MHNNILDYYYSKFNFKRVNSIVAQGLLGFNSFIYIPTQYEFDLIQLDFH